MARKHISILGLLLLPAFGPNTAEAQGFDFGENCSLGSLKVCASLDVAFAPAGPGGGTIMTLRVRNLAGSLGSVPWFTSGFGFNNLSTNFNDYRVFQDSYGSLEGAARWVKQPWWDQDSRIPTMEFNYLGDGRTGTGATNRDILSLTPIVGCAVPGNLPFFDDQSNPFGFFGYFQTCGDGSVVFPLFLPQDWQLTSESQFFISGYIDNGTAVDIDFTATPEPVTLTLFGTGLLAIGAARRRRTAKGWQS